ncbi:MAG: GreA/GreB family elongation factor, partial [Patescibacteria group bacterium]
YNETDLEHGKVGYNTPLAMSLLGLKLGEGRESTTPKGRAKFDVIVLYTSWDDVPEDLRNNPLLSGKPEE